MAPQSSAPAQQMSGEAEAAAATDDDETEQRLLQGLDAEAADPGIFNDHAFPRPVFGPTPVPEPFQGPWTPIPEPVPEARFPTAPTPTSQDQRRRAAPPVTEPAVDPVPGQRRSAEHDPADDAVRQSVARRRRLLDDLPQQLRAGLRRSRDLPPSERPQAEALARLTVQPEAPGYAANDDKRRRLQPEVLLVGTARGKEIIFDTLTPLKKAAFREAMAKEWSRWQQLKATIPVSADMLQELPPDLQIVGTRWVLTEKANGTAKARLVVQGCQEKTNDIRSDSPTGSRDCLMLTLIHAAQPGWSASQYDADCAYLQSAGIDRTLVLRMPRKQPPPGQEPGALAIATGAIYGTKDAGRHWYMHLRKHLQQAGFFESRLEKGTYGFHVDGKLVCMIHTHVDDLLIARQTDCPVLDTIIAKLTKVLHLRKSEGDVLTYLGRRIEFRRDEIRVTQVEATETLEPIVLTAARRCLPDSPLTAEELSDYRSLEGSIQWLTQQTRPDFAVHASKGAQCMAKATIRDALTLNRYAADIKATKDRGLVFRRNIVDLSLGTTTIVAYGDASFASSEGEKSQHGELIMITHEPAKLLSGHFELGHLISYKSGTIKRVVRSTLASEAYSISEAAEQAEWVRHVLHELHSGPSITYPSRGRDHRLLLACHRVHRQPQPR